MRRSEGGGSFQRLDGNGELASVGFWAGISRWGLAWFANGWHRTKHHPRGRWQGRLCTADNFAIILVLQLNGKAGKVSR